MFVIISHLKIETRKQNCYITELRRLSNHFHSKRCEVYKANMMTRFPLSLLAEPKSHTHTCYKYRMKTNDLFLHKSLNDIIASQFSLV